MTTVTVLEEVVTIVVEQGPPGPAGPPGSVGGTTIVPVTTTAAPTAEDSGNWYTNEGAAGSVTVTLPTAVAGAVFSFYVQAAQSLVVTAASGDTIRIAGSITGGAGSISSAVVGSSVTLVAINASEWVTTSSVGSWSI